MPTHFLIYFNSTHSQLDGTWPYYCVLTTVELIGIAVSYFAVAYMMLLQCYVGAYHFNIRVIWFFMGVEYATQLSDRTLQIFLIFNHEEDGE
ncbi:hypothetical protein GCK32_010610, partial [Trichostrongylus colubriformis]